MKYMILFLTLLLVLPLQAQTDADLFPLAFKGNNQIWAYDPSTGEFNQLTDDIFVEQYAVSSGGQWVAYDQFAPVTLDMIERVGGMSGSMPTDIWYANLTTGATYLAAEQPANAVFGMEGQPDFAYARGGITWSPDEERIAWMELRYPDQDYWLGIHDLRTGQTSTYPLNLPVQHSIPSPFAIYWQDGIALVSKSLNRDTGIVETRILIFNDDGSVRWNIPMNREEHPEEIRESLWVYNTALDIVEKGRWYFYVSDGEGTGVLIDPRNELVVPFNGEFELFHTHRSGQSLTARRSGARVDDEQAWEITAADGSTHTITLPWYVLPQLAPDGSMIAAYDTPARSNLSIWRAGDWGMLSSEQDLRINSADWGQQAWRTVTQPDNQAETITCPDFTTSRLVVGGLGRVIPGMGANRLRANSSADANPIGEIPEGGVFLVLDGPRCQGGFAWWQVDYEGRAGWTAEGAGETYWLEPVLR